MGIILSLLVSKKVLAGWQGPDQGVRWGKTGPALGESRGKTWSGVLEPVCLSNFLFKFSGIL